MNIRKGRPNTRTPPDMVGQRFGKYTVIRLIAYGSYDKGGRYERWECLCDCGKRQEVRGGNLRSGRSQGCRFCAADRRVNTKKCAIDYNVWFRLCNRSDQKGLAVGVTPEYLLQLIEEQSWKCALSGVPICFGRTRRDETTASPDRIDTSKGYVEGNVRWVHKVVNSMRNRTNTDEFIEWCQKIVDHSKLIS